MEKNTPQTKDELLQKYWLKTELQKFCREKELPAGGSKGELIQVLSDWFDGKIFIKSKIPKATILSESSGPFELEGIIPQTYKNDEEHRAFFAREIGPRFKFNIPFMDWMKSHAGTGTYAQAIEYWLQIEEEKRSGKKFPIDTQFEYNRYTRAFFEANPGLTRQDCLRCWNYKKGQLGSHAYESEDLLILEKK